MIKVGEYVRTYFGIAKLLKKEKSNYSEQIIYTFDKLDESLWSGDLPNEMWKSEIDWETQKYRSPFIKHSKNIIDLIEVGDYVNGEKIITITNDRHLLLDRNVYLFDKFREIKTILTKEQYEANCYKVKEE